MLRALQPLPASSSELLDGTSAGPPGSRRGPAGAKLLVAAPSQDTVNQPRFGVVELCILCYFCSMWVRSYDTVVMFFWGGGGVQLLFLSAQSGLLVIRRFS